MTPGETADAGDPFLSPKRGGTEVYLIRHGDALPDAAEVVLDGAYDSQPLSLLGRRQAEALAQRLREVSLAAVYSSPIVRAQQTAAAAAAALGLEVLIDPALREVEVGAVGPDVPPGATPEQLAQALRARLREVARVALTTGTWASIPGSEPSAALRARAAAAMARIAARHPGQRIAVVSHAGLINAYIADMLGIPRDFFFPCANTAVSIVRLRGTQRLLLSLNDIAHLQQARLTPGGSA
jgi:broad specificity phosphatase PhoE